MVFYDSIANKQRNQVIINGETHMRITQTKISTFDSSWIRYQLLLCLLCSSTEVWLPQLLVYIALIKYIISLKNYMKKLWTSQNSPNQPAWSFYVQASVRNVYSYETFLTLSNFPKLFVKLFSTLTRENKPMLDLTVTRRGKWWKLI